MISRSNDIILLLGAGASVDAGIPASQTMIDKIEGLLEARSDWKDYRDLYFLVKSSILYISGLRGQFNARDFYNIETLVQTLYELERREEHQCNPFFQTGNPTSSFSPGGTSRGSRPFGKRFWTS